MVLLPIQLIVKPYLQDTDEENGSFEIVPGSHLFTDFEIDDEGRIDEKYIPVTGKDIPVTGKDIPVTVKCNLPKGSVIIRDKRTWHRGTKNNIDKVRYMIGTSYSMNWYKLRDLSFNKDCYELFDE